MTSTDGHVLYCIGNGLIVVLTENDCGTLQPLPMSSAKVCVKAHLPGLPDRHLDARRRVHQRRLGSEDLAVGVDVDGGGAGSATGATGGLGLNVGISGVAEEMMGSIYRSLKALQNKSHERHSILKEKVDGMGLNLRALYGICSCVRTSSPCSLSPLANRRPRIEPSLIYSHGFLYCLTPMLYATQSNWPDSKVFRSSARPGEVGRWERRVALRCA